MIMLLLKKMIMMILMTMEMTKTMMVMITLMILNRMFKFREESSFQPKAEKSGF